MCVGWVCVCRVGLCVKGGPVCVGWACVCRVGLCV